MLSDDLINIVLSYGEVGRRKRVYEIICSIEAIMTNKPVAADSIDLSWDEWNEALLRYNICNKQQLYEKIAKLPFDNN